MNYFNNNIFDSDKYRFKRCDIDRYCNNNIFDKHPNLTDMDNLWLIFNAQKDKLRVDYPELAEAIQRILPPDQVGTTRENLRQYFAKMIDSFIKQAQRHGIRVLWSEMISAINGATARESKDYIQMD